MIACTFTACNNDVFVEDFRPAETDIKLDGNGGSYFIRTENNDFDYVEFRIWDGYDLNTIIYDSEGNPEIFSTSTYPLKNYGKASYFNDLFSLSLLRTPEGITVTVDENNYDRDISGSLMMSTSEVTYSIEVTVSPGARYDIESIDYTLEYPETEKYSVLGQAVTVSNNSDTPSTFTISHIYKESYSKAQFNFEYEFPPAYRLLARPTLVEIPLPTADDTLALPGCEILFNPEAQNIGLQSVDPATSVDVIIPPHTTQRILLWIKYTKYSLWASVTLLNPVSGKRQNYNPLLVIDNVTGYSINQIDI